MTQDEINVFNRGVDTRNWVRDYLKKKIGIELEMEKVE